MTDTACGSCGGSLVGLRADSLYCSPACKQRAYRERKEPPTRNASVTAPVAVVALDRPVPIADDDEYGEHPWEQGRSTLKYGSAQAPRDVIKLWAFHVAYIAGVRPGRVRDAQNSGLRYAVNDLYRVDEPLPDELPASIDPDSAADLARELAAPLRRAHELLALLDRRAAEHWSGDEA
jgi:hypothetical protein